MLVTWDTGSIGHRCHGKHGEHQKKLYKWYGDRVERGESRKPTEPAIGEMIFPGTPVSPKSPPQMGKGQFFLHCHKKMSILFHSGNKRQFKLCSKSVSNYQSVEAEKLFKKSHIFAWFHCTHFGCFSALLETLSKWLLTLVASRHFSRPSHICWDILWVIGQFSSCSTLRPGKRRLASDTAVSSVLSKYKADITLRFASTCLWGGQ